MVFFSDQKFDYLTPLDFVPPFQFWYGGGRKLEGSNSTLDKNRRGEVFFKYTSEKLPSRKQITKNIYWDCWTKIKEAQN